MHRMRYALMNPILDELVREGRIRISGDIIVSLIGEGGRKL